MKSSLAKYQRWKSFVSIFCVLALFAGMVPTASAAGGVEAHVVSNTVMPSGIVLNLFDYWVTDNRTDPDTETPLASGNQQKYWNTGINQNHALKFTSLGTGNKSINQWTGYSGGVYSGIVQDRLLGNYPVLKAGNLYSANTQGSGLPLNQTTAAESLDYLFDKSEQTGKKAFWNVQGLLQIDSDGYYYYNADTTKCWKSTDANHSGYQTANYAAFDEKTNSFKLYDSWGVQSAGADSSAKGQFFPFTDASKVFSVGTDGKLSSTVSSDSNTINHYFGMTMTTRFVQRYEGKTTNDSTAKDMTFEFAGDDDVWLFIDGVLVSDLGGIHNQATTSINFNTGAITVNGQPAGTLKSKMKGYYGDSSIWSGETFADNTYHTMKMFYLERGGTNSNLAMKFNLAHVPETDGVKIDQYGHPLSGVNFTLYAAKPAEAGMSGYVVDTTKGVKGDGVLAEGTTNEDGKFVLSDSLEASISLNELKQQGITHLLLREKGDRVGYRPMEDIYLQLADYDADILLLNDETHQWRTGSYAQPKETVYANPNITLQNEDGSLIEGSAGTADISDKESGLMFAVIMRRLDGVGDHPPAPDDRWGIVSGSALNGWNITPVTGSHIPAVLDMIHDESNPSRNYFTFTPCSNGSYMTELNNCPGDMRDYYFWREEKNPDQMEDVVYSIAYYYTTEKDLKDATVENTHWVVSRDFERQFTATLYIPNVRNYLRVQKTDTNGKQISGAEFSLYKKEDVTVVNTGTEEAPVLAYTVKDGAKPYDVTETDINGLAEFPSEDCDLDIGEYYLVESRAPDGYRVNATPVHVIVNNDGVLADAGTADDGVSVSLHEGTLLRSMTQYAVSDNVDRTLTDVIATQLRGVYDESEQRLVLSEAEPSVTSQLTVNRDLFSETSEILGYVDSNHRENHWVTDEGWIWFKMQQDYAGLSAWENSTAHKRNLGDMDITPLFTGETTVIMQDQPVGSLTVSKTVAVKEDSDGAPDPDQEFQFGITLENEDTALPGTLTLKGGSTDNDVDAPEDETVTLTDRKRHEGTVTLKHGQTFTISDLPVGTTCRVEELRDDLDAAKWKTTVSGAASHVFGGTIKSPGQQLTADFTNTYGEYIIYQPVTVNDAIKVTKAYAEGGDVYDGDVQFTVTPDAGAPAPARSEVTISGKGTGSFGGITFEEAGEYTYTVREVNDKVQGMTYDSSVYTVTFTVEKVDKALQVTDTVYAKVGGDAAVQQPAAPAESPVKEPAKTPADTPTKDSAETPAEQPEEKPAGEPEDKQTETPTEEPEQTPSPGEAPEQTLTAESLQKAPAPQNDEVYGEKTGFTFVNSYEKPDIPPVETTVSEKLIVTKAYAKGGDVYGGDVRFTVTRDDGAPAPTRSAVTISGKGTGSFGSITFTQPGTYTYTVRENAGNVDHMTYDDTVYTVTIIVEQDSSSSPLRATVRHRVDGKDYEYDPASGMVFTNRYDKSDEPATGTLRISKTVSGSGADQNAKFRFRVRIGALNGTYGSVRFTQGEATVSVKAGGSVSIPGLPAGSAYEVTELDAAGYTVTSRNDRGMIPAGGSVTAAFNNEKKGGSSSGDGGDSDTPALNREEHYAYIIGYKDGLLRPNGNISRGEVATIFFRLLRDQIRTEYWSKTNAYSDVPADMWCNNAISTLSNMGILSGYSDGTFRPNAPITRAELTKIAAGFFADKRVTAHYDGRFSDVSGSEWFISALEKAIEEGVVEGYGNGTFAPNQYITRAQACTMINRTLGRKPIEGALLPENRMLTWPDCQPGAWYYAQMQEATNSHDYVWAGSSSEKTEKWTKKLPDRDWAALEHTWSNANSAAGGEAMK